MADLVADSVVLPAPMLAAEGMPVLHGIDRARADQDGDRVAYWRHPGFAGMGMLKARFRTHHYDLHTHATYVVALITEGCERLRIGRRREIAPAGTVIVVNPEECHDGEPGVDRGWAYRVLYPPVSLLTELAAELGRAAAPEFACCRIDDPALAAAVLHAHRAAEGGAAVDAEAAMLTAMQRLIVRYGEGRRLAETASECSGVGRRMVTYRGLIAEAGDDAIDLARLGAAAGVNRFQVIRDFKRQTGLTPFRFIRNQRLRQASRLIENGAELAEAAAAAGFSDQSHLARVFRGSIGITPGAFRAAAMEWRGGIDMAS